MAQTAHALQGGHFDTAPLLPAIFNIFKFWGLTGSQQMTLLGLTNEKTFYNWKSEPRKARLSKDVLERISYILGIFESLQVLLQDPELADGWLARPNSNPLFNGTSPMDRMLAGQVTDLAVVRNFLDGERYGA